MDRRATRATGLHVEQCLIAVLRPRPADVAVLRGALLSAAEYAELRGAALAPPVPNDTGSAELLSVVGAADAHMLVYQRPPR